MRDSYEPALALGQDQQPPEMELAGEAIDPVLAKEEALPSDTPPESNPEAPGWLRRNLFKLSLAAFVGGTAVSAVVNPMDATVQEVVKAAPWVAATGGVSESMWISGAAMMAASAGKRIGNPFKLRSRWGEISQSLADSKLFKAGLAINTLGALGTAGVVEVGAVTSLPPETWPGATGLAAADVVSTVAIRGGIYTGLKQVGAAEKATHPGVKVRKAKLSDMDRLADLDLLLFDKAYGGEKPPKAEIVDMLTQRYKNNPDWMFVSEMDGEIEGFVTAFRTNKPIENFVSWEESTAGGTLDGVIDPKGKYVYVANMTITHEAVEQGAEDMLLANLFANAIRDGVEYGYFVSRMPHFKRWLEKRVADGDLGSIGEANIEDEARSYASLRREEDNKLQDPQLRMYEGLGYSLKGLAPDAFEDDASLNFGVICKADIPPKNNKLKSIKPLRAMMAYGLRQAAKKPKLLRKIF